MCLSDDRRDQDTVTKWGRVRGSQGSWLSKVSQRASLAHINMLLAKTNQNQSKGLTGLLRKPSNVAWLFTGLGGWAA